MTKKLLSLLLVLAMIVTSGALLTSCGEDTGGTGNGKGEATDDTFYDQMADKTIRVWGAFGEDYWESFKRDYPDIELDHATSSDNSLANLAAFIKAGNQPDMFYTSNAAQAPLGEAVNKSLVQPLDEYFDGRDPLYTKQDLPTWYDKFVTFPDEQGTDHIYGVYTDVSVACLVWNKRLFEAEGLDPNTPPKTWKEMKEVSDKLTKKDANGMITQAGFIEYRWWFQHWRLTFGTTYQSHLGKVDVNTPEFASVLNYLKSFPESYGGEDKLDRNTISWDNNNVGLTVQDVGYGQALGKDFPVGVAPMPYNDDPQFGLTDTTISGYAWQWYGIPVGCKNKDGGWLFSRWAVTKGSMYVQERDANANPEKWNPVYLVHKPTKEYIFNKYLDRTRSDVKENLETREEIFDKITLDQPVNAPINTDFVNVILEKTCGEIVNGDITVADGLAKIQQGGDKLYSMYEKRVEKAKDEDAATTPADNGAEAPAE